MDLTSDQCSAIAQIIPVLMIAIILELRAAAVRAGAARWLAYVAFGTGLLSSAGGIWVAVSGIDGGLQADAGLTLVCLVGAYFLCLLVVTVSVVSMEARKD